MRAQTPRLFTGIGVLGLNGVKPRFDFCHPMESFGQSVRITCVGSSVNIPGYIFLGLELSSGAGISLKEFPRVNFLAFSNSI